ncbi:class D beta-lactamase [Pseudalkalibacillus sp. Hm43]|uniref:class D beta-lactamase n=1 Tax=Pseudalkalibacillus sp. Hm43 TaxID=3450742 RepID=UPI003F421AAD
MKKIIWFTVTFLLFSMVGWSVGTNADGEKHGNGKMKEIDVSDAFGEHEGTFILKDLKRDKTYVYNPERANASFTPESTFKVPNALIGLEVGVVRDEYDVKRWDGVEREFDIWNDDHTLGSGIRYSVIWYYQEMAREIGHERMQTWVNDLSYGNQDLSGGIDRFWLDNTLEITPLAQADFMEKLFEEDLPFSEKSMKTVKRMMIHKENDDYIVYGKTGTRLSDYGLGWFVGFVENEKGAYIFVTNVSSSGTTATNITYDILRDRNIIADE